MILSPRTAVQRLEERLEERLKIAEARLDNIEQTEAGHVEALIQRYKFLREQLKNVEQKVDAAGGLCSLGEVPAYKVQQLIERYKLIRSYVRGISERQRTLERALKLSVSLDGPQRFKDEACNLLMCFLEECGEDTTPLLVTRTVHLLDRSGYCEWEQE